MLFNVNRVVRHYDRYCVVCLVLLQAAASSDVPETSNTFECSYDMCILHRRDGRTTIGCIVKCVYGEELVFSGNCGESYKLISSWFGRVNRRLPIRDIKTIKIGIAYYFSGYILRPLSSFSEIVPQVPGKYQLSGVAKCWKRGSFGGGSVELKTQTLGSYKLDVESKDEGAEWIAEDGGSTEIVDILMQNLSCDIHVFHTCSAIVNAVAVGHSSDRSPRLLDRTAVVRRDACSGGIISWKWGDMWTNWTKYCEMDETTQRDSSFSLRIQNYESGSRIPKLVGLFAVVFGAFTLLSLFCCLSIKQRRSLFKDIRGESSLRLKEGSFDVHDS